MNKQQAQVDALKVFVEETFHSIVKRVEYIFNREEVDMMEWVRDHVQGLIDEDKDHVNLDEEYVHAMILLYDRVFPNYHLVDYYPCEMPGWKLVFSNLNSFKNKVAHEALIHIMSKWTAYVTLLHTCDEKLDTVVNEIHTAMKEINAAPHSLGVMGGVIDEGMMTSETAPRDHIFSSDLYFNLKVLLLENPTSKALYEVERISPYHSHVFNFPSPSRFHHSNHTYEFCPPKFHQHINISSIHASVGEQKLEFFCVGMRQDDGDMIFCFKGPETTSPRNPWIEVLVSPYFVLATGCYNFSEERPFSKNTSILLAERCGKNYTVTCPGDAAFKLTFQMEIYELNDQ